MSAPLARTNITSRRIALAGATAIALLSASTRPVLAAPAAGTARIDRTLVRLDPRTGLAEVVFGSGRYLTLPSTDAPERVVLDYLSSHRADFGLDAAGVESLVVTKNVRTQDDGASHVLVGQQIAGVPVHQALMTALVARDGRLVLIGGSLSGTRTAGSVAISAGDAVARSAQRAGARSAGAPAGSGTRAKGKHVFSNPYARGVRDPNPVSAELVWTVQADRSLRPAWLTDVELSSRSWTESLVDAASGAVISHESRYRHSGPEGNVFREQHPGVTGATQRITTLSGGNDDWVVGRMTSGNNVNAYLDRDNQSINNEYQPTTPPAGDPAYQHFDYTFTNAWSNATDVADVGALDTDRDASMTQLFYYTNVMHDWLLSYGFDEKSGNFQAANYTGGTGGDMVIAEAQDGWAFGCPDGDDADSNPERCLNNANFGTSKVDGSTARMQMYLWARNGDPSRDGAMDGDVIAHEYGHGVSNRLVPGGVSGGTNQSGSLGEGWSDVISFLKWNDAVIGEYVTTNATTGVRSVAYDKSNRDYASYNASASVDSPHFNGEIWATVLYDVRRSLGVDTTTRLVLDGMRSTPNGPNMTFINARDGLLAADMAKYGGANQCALWTAFAGRGLGVNAVSAGLHSAQVNEKTIPAGCLPKATVGGPYNTTEGTNVSVSAQSSSKGTAPSAGFIAKYEWDLDNDGQYDDGTGSPVSYQNVGQDGAFTIGLKITDAFGNTSTATGTVNVANVAPIVELTAITPVDEFGRVTMSGTIRDPGWEDSLYGTVDWGDGDGVHSLGGYLEQERPDATLTWSITHGYGDNGSFAVTVSAQDDDATSTGTTAAEVLNVPPTADIDGSGEQSYGGASAFVVRAGASVSVPARSTDPGSDDLAFTWGWDDGTSSTQTSLVNPPAADPANSPSFEPRDVSLTAAHAFGGACVYDVALTVTDDDGGSASDASAVVVTGTATLSKGSGYWLNQFRLTSTAFTSTQLQCYLDIVGYFSSVFPAGMTREFAVKTLNSPSKSGPTIVFDQLALAAWLNFANGAVGFDTAVDTDGNKTLDSTFGAAMLTAETIRLNPASTSAQIKAQKDILERIVQRDGG
ncbi:MAG: M36 family metallopeptidase [Mycobacteriales bacterium]